jgi:membrane protein DedA with SNARE-associated domain
VWATYAGLIGYLGGTTFRDDLWQGLALGFGIALAVALVIELVRRYGRKG